MDFIPYKVNEYLENTFYLVIIYLFLLRTIIEIYDFQEHLEKIILLTILKLEFIKVLYMIGI